jgi:radical SAM protein with 4Fe4S-binding SPASM domain
MGLDDEKFFPLDVRELAMKGSKLSAKDIYSNPLFGEWCQRFPLNMHQCADCIAISVCGGGCPYASDMTDGSIWEIDKRVCHQAKNILDWMVWETYEYAGELEQEKTRVNEKKNQQNLTQETVDSKLDGINTVIHLDPRFNQRAVMTALHRRSDGEHMESWFRMKFYDDLSDIRPERDRYYKHYVHHFVSQYFSRERVAGKKILDFGCGPGFYSAILGQRGASVVGIDLSPFLIAKANGHKARLHLDNIEFIQADFVKYATHMAPLQFDYVIAIDTFVSFDYSRSTHDHERVKKAFGGIKRVLKDNGRCFVIESHPLFGRVFQEIPSNTGEPLCVRSPHYKIDYRLKSDVHHWFTLDEMTRATSENRLAVSRIFEPDPSPTLKSKNPSGYAFHLKYPGMIVYEICKIPEFFET